MIITHLSFVDDVIMFCNDSIKFIKIFRNLLLNFEKESSLTFNKNKSYFIASSSIPIKRINQISNLIVFNSQILPITYLGTPIYKGRKKSFLFDGVINNISIKIAS